MQFGQSNPLTRSLDWCGKYVNGFRLEKYQLKGIIEEKMKTSFQNSNMYIIIYLLFLKKLLIFT